MILIADSGSTKTDWRLWNPENNEVYKYSSKGLNPYFVDSLEITSVISSTIPFDFLNEITHIYFYGSGCSTKDSVKIVFEGLKGSCPRATIEVNHDLLAGARALLGDEPGIACILGTGSNACYYNGKDIERNAVSYGFIMGDEGSGNHLGRLLLKSIFSGKAPIEIQKVFKEDFPELDLALLLRQLYHLPNPNKFLASFSPFIVKHRDNDFVNALIQNSLNQFLDEFIEPLIRDNDDKIGFQGSIAHYFKDDLIKVLKSRKLNPYSILKKPIEKLLIYHQKR